MRFKHKTPLLKRVWFWLLACPFSPTPTPPESQPQTPRSRKRRRNRNRMPSEVKCQIKRELMADWDGRCAYCHKGFLKRKQATLDHVVPKSRNGNLTDPSNLVLCCRNCNESKRDRTPEEWAADILAFAEKRRGSTSVER